MTNKNGIHNLAQLAMMTAVIEVCKFALAGILNVELTSFLIILFTLYFGRKTFYVIPCFIVIEIMIFGFELMWVLAYVYVWPILYLLTLALKKYKSTYSMAMLSGVFGLTFGFLCSFPYLFITTGTNPDAGLSSAIAYWIAGIPFDIVHGVSNFIIMIVLYNPIRKIFEITLSKRAD